MAAGESYDEFVGKFKKGKTPDECFTPPEVYEAVKKWMMSHFKIAENTPIVRPFYPGGDYENYDYPMGCVVIDNPPFSILKKICNFYDKKGIKYILFCPGLVLRSYLKGLIVVHENIVYENGAIIPTNFAHNFEHSIETAPELDAILKKVQPKMKKKRSNYSFPDEIVSAPRLRSLAETQHIKINNFKFKKRLDEMKEYKKTIYGGGILISRKDAEKVKKAREANKRVKERQKEKDTFQWHFSDREKKIIEKL